MFLVMVGDAPSMPSYPFILNFSSRQSYLFVSDSLTFSPLEVYLVVMAVGWFLHSAGARRWRVGGGALLAPVLLLGTFVVGGLVWGLARGGSSNVAIWEARPLLYLVAMFLATSTLFTRTEQYVRLAWVVVLAISVQNVFALRYYFSLPPARRAGLEALTEHTTSLVYGWIFLLAIALWSFRRTSWWARVLVAVACVPTLWVFVLSQRRAAVVALVAGFVVLAVVMFFRQRKVFLIMVPVAVILTFGYTVAFWNATEGVGFGARAIKSVVAADQVSERDASSNLYRKIENFDLVYTLRAEPLTGVGFGKPFLQPAPLPDISFFVFHEFIPHNQFLWIWLKTGFFGFVTLLVLIAAALRSGIRAAMNVPSGDLLAVTACAVAFVPMFFVLNYVDISWEPKMCLLLAFSLAACANVAALSRDEQKDVPTGRLDPWPSEPRGSVVRSGLDVR
jgi:O-antigen ligase